MIGRIRIAAEIIGVPGRWSDPMAPTLALTEAEAKRQRKMAKRAAEVLRGQLIARTEQVPDANEKGLQHP